MDMFTSYIKKSKENHRFFYEFNLGLSLLSLIIALKYFYVNQEIQGFFLILNHHKCLILWVYGHYKQFTLSEQRSTFDVQSRSPCSSDDYLFHENSVTKYLFFKYSSLPPP